MADETMFARLCNAAHFARHPALRPPAAEAAQRDETIAIVRALLAELRTHGMSDDVMAKLADAGVDVGDAKTIWAEAIDAILAEAGGSGGA